MDAFFDIVAEFLGGVWKIIRYGIALFYLACNVALHGVLSTIDKVLEDNPGDFLFKILLYLTMPLRAIFFFFNNFFEEITK
ncbi:MAG: hypothetical protein A2928_00735 [Candidatus Taylorbacteria bacterium RIFCSPLOWO2_01_FULL_45_15b]|uniref:Uncharacterized protein n=1 Tax=Candidatus Taylorbacteria bacterium RIFCSPLOWO2_01_FULL_45_15b TaxID=1802319 RepID=A0A1G2NA99_9BACT|nr:MAG: hypothetical protein A2928_00735 [Candidatus Taylorbacteria bacterium RIFCSPLOWO2_01_FULL_45_15b]